MKKELHTMSARGSKPKLFALRITEEMAARVTNATIELANQRNETISELNFMREAISEYVEKIEHEKTKKSAPRLF